jgi:hypothetical protein
MKIKLRELVTTLFNKIVSGVHLSECVLLVADDFCDRSGVLQHL